ncbi:MAG: sel1 repeat family protein [Clostridiales bacterium]|nr:sel1 repeat family protein [Clostridiales bacterium]
MSKVGFATVSAIIGSVSNPQSLAFILFYVNIGLVLFVVIQVTALIMLTKKTSCASVVGLATVFTFGMSAVLFLIQLLMYVLDSAGALYVISFCLCLTYGAFIMACVYNIMLSKNSLKKLCIVAGIMDIIPPVGAVFSLVLAAKLKSDTTAQEYIYKGYAYTYAALGEYCALHKPAFADFAGNEEPEPMPAKDIKRKLKELKSDLKSPEGQYAYAVALATYTPQNSATAVKYMKKAASGNHTAALFNMGYYYELGAYVGKDLKKARDCYMRAAQAGDEDAALRLGILDIKAHKAEDGFKLFKTRAEERNDSCALYNMAVCYELGLGVQPDRNAAMDIYCRCDAEGTKSNGHADEVGALARKRIFAIAATDINSAQNGDFFRKVTDRPFKGAFRTMLDGLIEIKKRHAADAADRFLKVVKKGGEWEGLARCLVGTLYLDNGKELKDKVNGAEFIETALDVMPEAKDILSVIPPSILKQIRARSLAEQKKKNENKTSNSEKTETAERSDKKTNK